VYFLVFGVVKLVSTLLFALLAAPFFIACCALWRAAGCPEWGRRFCRGLWAVITQVLLLLVGFVQITFSGQIDPDAPFIVPNHVCFFDGFLFLGLAFRPLGKRELLRISCLTDIGNVYNGIAVDRMRSSGLSQVLLEIANDSNEPVIVILPEGASTPGDYMFHFHLGAFLSDLPAPLVTIRYKIWGTKRSLHHISSGWVKPVCTSGGSAMTNRLGSASGGHIITPLSAFFPSFAAALRVTQVGCGAFEHARITSVIIHRHIRIFCSSCFSFCRSLSSISFECDSELIRIESKAFSSSSLESITIPRHVQFIDGSAFPTISKISISVTSDYSYFGVKSYLKRDKPF
jgi:1-acyl-sn-glycerol-3-phosphate acyltransferase